MPTRGGPATPLRSQDVSGRVIQLLSQRLPIQLVPALFKLGR